MRIAIACPAPAGSRLGNRMTAVRWQSMLVELGHDAAIVEEIDSSFDLLVALHAAKSAEIVRASREDRPDRPIVVALTGTDLYRDIRTDVPAQRSLEIADRLVVLHDLASDDVPARVRGKVRVIRQSAEPPRDASASEAGDGFDVAFVAHARAEKDPLRAALAVRALPPSSKIRIVHAGRALSPDVELALRREANENPRYRWLGEIDPSEALALIARSKLLVLTSEMEGGANVLGEAIASGTPPIASRIPACVAALGADYPGLFSVGDTEALTGLLARAETDPSFYGALVTASGERRHLFDPATEREAWRRLLAELAAPSTPADTEPR